MDIYFIRHGIAADPSEYEYDRDRPLTDKGREKTERVAEKIGQIGVKFDLILTSPLVRAKQTAQILLELGLTNLVEEFVPLSPGGNLQEFLQTWSESDYGKTEGAIALVGHQPDLTDWAEQLIWGEIGEKLILKKAGIIGLSVPPVASPLGQCQLFLLTSPKWFN
jgi:phosphohistidine phosphatase